MGSDLSKEKELRLRSYEIDKQIKEDRRNFKKKIKVLLMGLDKSGKSTIVKKIKLIQRDYSQEELSLYRIIVYKNLIHYAQAIVYAIKKLRLEPKKTINKVYMDRILEYNFETNTEFQLSPEIVAAVNSIWNDPIIPEVLTNANDLCLMDSAFHFLDAVMRIGSRDYVPSQDDILMSQVKTSGISEIRFDMNKLNIHILEIDKKLYQPKIFHHFEFVTSIIYCVALDEYDQVELGENRLKTSLQLFETIVNNRWFQRISIILSLNKFDLFRAKLPRVPLKDFFPEYLGGSDINKATKYILWRFTQTNRARLKIYSHWTTRR